VRCWLLAALTACYSPRPLDSHCARCNPDVACLNGESCIDGRCQTATGVCDGELDGGIDGDPNVDARTCFGVEAVPFHEMCIPMGQDLAPMVTLPSMIQTGGVSADCTYVDQADPGRMKPALCVIAADRITIDNTVRVIGTRPLVLLARTSLSITATGILDVAGHAADNTSPAGANEPACSQLAGGPVVGSSGAGGGPGGTFRSQGGAGGPNGGGVVVSAPAVSGGPLLLRGGCRGGNGGVNGTANGGISGHSGGVVYLLSPSFDIAGTINASGGAGRGSAASGAGGAGGGSGGMILLWSTKAITLASTAQIFAVGGGGGSGGPNGGTGAAGDDPDGPTSPATSTPVGGGPGAGGSGSLGAPGNAGTGGIVASGPNGGGGGGGGVGYIGVTPQAQPSSQFAPPPS
jgi:hypothetical protein